jgi:PAS domain S-box-containing protein
VTGTLADVGAAGSHAGVSDLARAQAQVAALEQLLEVYERTSLEQTERLDAALAEARTERQRLEEVFMQAPAAITVLEGPAHTFSVVNPLYAELIGRRDVQGKPVREALPELEGQGFFELLDRVYTTGEPFAAREMLVRIDRHGTGSVEDVYVNFVYQPLKRPDGATTAIMAHAVDVTEQVRARKDVEQKAAELSRLARELERSNRELDQFAYVASHDLKAPLRGIANLTEWIQEDLGEALTGESAAHMGLLKGRVHRMEALIDGILTYSRAGREKVDVSTVDLRELAAESIELASPPEGTAVTIAGDLPVIEAERVPLQQVLLNLIGNALKHNAREGATLEVIGAAHDDRFVQISVRDNGPGIPAEYQERIWQIFQTLAARDKVEGTGIGLSVVRKLVEHRGGRAWLESEPGSGATFHFTWPKRPGTST